MQSCFQHNTYQDLKRKPEFNDNNRHLTKKPKYDTSGYNIQCLHGNENHELYFYVTLSMAKVRTIITTYKLDVEKSVSEELQGILEGASEKGVKIDIYYNHLSLSCLRSKFTLLFFQQFENIRLHKTENHAKALLIDDHTICLGSYNWLSTSNKTDENVSLILDGKSWKPIRDKFKNYLKAYEDKIQNVKNEEHFEQKYSISQSILNANPSSLTAHLITTPKKHYELIIETFIKSTQCIEIHSPFVTTSSVSLKQRLPPQVVKSHIQSNKKLTLVSADRDRDLKCYLENIQEGSRINFVTQKCMHQKILVLDKETIAIGSYNWLSANLNVSQKNRINCYDATLILRGEPAKKIIKELARAKILQS